jgi:uncharacterized protein (DUF58 family)
MAASAQTPEALLRRLEWTVLRRLDGLLQGDYRTLLRGAGIDLASLREYQDGDDVRYIDWNVTARLQSLHVREYQQDREMTAWFLLDLSPSVDFGSGSATKRMVLAEVVAVLARLLAFRGNHVGALLFSTAGIERVVPPRSGRRQVLHLLDLVGRPQPAPSRRLQGKRRATTDLGAVLHQAASILRRHSVVFVVSDFISQPGWQKALGLLARRHEVVAVRLFDPLEATMPEIGLLAFQDAETGEQLLVDTGDRSFRRRFAAAWLRVEEALQAGLAAAGVDCLEISTEDDLLDAFVRFARMRRQRHRSGSSGTPPAPLPAASLSGGSA